jgi:selenoprotein W-related protein
VSLVEELVDKFEPEIKSIALVPSDGGRFEVRLDDELIYSKLETKRHVEEGEVALLLNRVFKRERKG